MSRSPRRLLRRAAAALAELEAVTAQYPDARTALERVLGSDGLGRLGEATQLLSEQADLLDQEPGETPTFS